MKFLKATLIVGGAVTQAVALPTKPLTDETKAALENLGVDVAKIPQLNGNGCEDACEALTEIYGSEKVITGNTPAYQDATKSFWSAQQGEVKPSCIFIPSVDKDVSAAVLASQLTECPFAAKSGGHAAFAGASNIEDGITILLRDLKEVSLNDDKSVAFIGAGNNWGQVYKALEPHGVTVVGGRMSGIGVGGLITGGGISYFSNKHGWALDNVESFEVVNAKNGEILKASEKEHSDLYWALRGGGNNFGLVTKFNLHTIPSSLLWGGTHVFSEDKFSDVISAFVDVAKHARDDGNAQQYVLFTSMGGSNIASAELTYTKDESNPAIFEKFLSIPSVSNTTSTRTLAKYCDDLNAQDPYGKRDVFWNRSFKLDEKFANWAVKRWFEMNSVVSKIPNALLGLTFQVITEPMLEKMSEAGGNALGLDTSSGPILLMHVLGIWSNASGDETIYQFLDDFFSTIADEAESRGLGNDFIYMNYASHFQDVISSYGGDNKEKLQEIASKYDPDGVYQKLQPGHFKLDGAPSS
ncbi:FAD-binding oxidoreductase [Aspergillus undulatus]|uniref:FAD-binding oxidoreductase n=1 Tax=Aspergillus undulatus TaxID=1810928 RepID=UPI003CCCC29A